MTISNPTARVTFILYLYIFIHKLNNTLMSVSGAVGFGLDVVTE